MVVVNGEVAEVVELSPNGDVHIREISTLELKWVDYYLCELIDPSKDGEALLTALGALHKEPDPADEEPDGDGADGE